ncbi:hypothetical protein [Haladaptatus sp. NG-SE-30]
MDADESITAPNPTDALGYRQRAYSATPLAYFSDYETTASRSNRRGGSRNSAVEAGSGLSVDEIATGALFRGRSHQRAIENLVVIHAEGRSNGAYIDALDRFVAAGGNLVLTDRGVSLLGVMENDLVGGISEDDVIEIEAVSATLSERVDDHPLLTDTRSIQCEFWKPAPLGYPTTVPGKAPLTVVEPTAFDTAGGSVAGYTDNDPFGATSDSARYVSAGTLTNGDGAVHVLGGLLPPAHQSDLHPFGVLEYATTFLGHTMLSNALGHTQKRYVDGEYVASFGQ